ncbi:MAG TPA: IclR family transcriptional regulator C-terminal domain-containing protein, partial [Ottowia sp.]|nr:IclR family transcriptional regulator C-terminal domain-containing protein [Ottowia sp.]
AQTRGSALDQSELLQGAIKALARSSGETASFYVRDGDERVCLFRENSSQTIRHHVDVGDRLPMNKGAAGLVLLAWSGETGELFERIRHDGFALSLGDRDPDAAAISAPLFDAHDKLLGALTISGLRSRFTSEAIQRFRDVLLQDVTRLEQEFGRRRPARLPLSGPPVFDRNHCCLTLEIPPDRTASDRITGLTRRFRAPGLCPPGCIDPPDAAYFPYARAPNHPCWACPFVPGIGG